MTARALVSGKGRDGVMLGGESEWLGTSRTRLMAYLSGDVGSAGVGKIRTCWDLSLTLGIPFSQSGWLIDSSGPKGYCLV